MFKKTRLAGLKSSSFITQTKKLNSFFFLRLRQIPSATMRYFRCFLPDEVFAEGGTHQPL
jgi:hypothetical protein